jgi:glycosyltransferase involved in cell wall biosynthesis
MTEYYRSLDIYIHPSLAEGLPRVVIEAERQALPACGAKASGTPELLDEDFVFKKQSPKAICEVLKKFNKSIMAEQARRNFERSMSYSVEVLDKRRKDFYSMVLNS